MSSICLRYQILMETRGQCESIWERHLSSRASETTAYLSSRKSPLQERLLTQSALLWQTITRRLRAQYTRSASRCLHQHKHRETMKQAPKAQSMLTKRWRLLWTQRFLVLWPSNKPHETQKSPLLSTVPVWLHQVSLRTRFLTLLCSSIFNLISRRLLHTRS